MGGCYWQKYQCEGGQVQPSTIGGSLPVAYVAPPCIAFAAWQASPDEIVSFFARNKDGRLRPVLEAVLPDVREALWRVPRARLR